MDSPVGLTPLSVDTEADDAVRAADELLASMSQEDLQVLTEDIPVVDPDDVEDFALTKGQEILRFGSATTDQDLEDLEKEARPKNTMRNTQWGINVYDAWRTCSTNKKRGIPSLEEGTKPQLDYFLPRFVNEARRQDGAPYPPRSLYQMMCSIQRHLRAVRKDCAAVCLVDISRPDQDFQKTVTALDAKMKTLTSLGRGVASKQAAVISMEDEVMLWERGIFSAETAQTLLRTVFYYVGKLFALRLDEQEHLMLSQVTFGVDSGGR